MPCSMHPIQMSRSVTAAIAVSEGQRLGIPIVAVVDSNCNPDHIDFVVPGNDDGIRALQLIDELVAHHALGHSVDLGRQDHVADVGT